MFCVIKELHDPRGIACLVGNWCAQSERDRRAGKLHPDCKRIAADLLGREALGAGYAAGDGDGDLGCARIAGCAEGDPGDSLCGWVRNVSEGWGALVAGHASGEVGGDVVVLEGDERPVDTFSN